MSRRLPTVLIADRDEIFCMGLARVLERTSRFRIVAACCDAAQTLATMRDRTPAIAVIDAGLLQGDAAIPMSALSQWDDVRVVVMGSAPDLTDVVSLERGFRPDDLIEVLEALRTEPPPPQGDGSVGAAMLSPRERQVLQLVADGYTSREIAEELEIKQRTVEVHRHNILSKLDLRGVAEMVKFAIREGLTKA